MQYFLCTQIFSCCFRKQYLKRPQKKLVSCKWNCSSDWILSQGFSLKPKGRLFANSCWNSVGIGCRDTKHCCLQLNMTLPNPLHTVPTKNCIWALTSNRIFFHVTQWIWNRISITWERKIVFPCLFLLPIQAWNTLGIFHYKTILTWVRMLKSEELFMVA